MIIIIVRISNIFLKVDEILLILLLLHISFFNFSYFSYRYLIFKDIKFQYFDIRIVILCRSVDAMKKVVS